MGRIWKMLASVLYRARARSSKRISPLKNPCKSSRTRPRCCSSTEHYLAVRCRLPKPPKTSEVCTACAWCDAFILHRAGRMGGVFSSRLELFGANALLAIALADGQLERPMRVSRLPALVMGIAAIAHHGITDREIEDTVDDRRADKDRP